MLSRMFSGALLVVTSALVGCTVPPKTADGVSAPLKLAAGMADKSELQKAAEYALDPSRFAQIGNPPIAVSRNRACVDDTSRDHTDSCLLELTLLDAGTTFDPGKPLAHPVAVATLRNISATHRTEAYLQIPPDATYAWVIMPIAGSDSLLSGFVNLKDYNDWRPLRGMQRLKVCHGAAHGTEKVAFYCCNGQCPSDGAIQKDTTKSTVTAMGMGRGEHTSPPWFSCALGCCYADF